MIEINRKTIREIIDIVKEANRKVIALYNSLSFFTETKQDGTPLTEVDKISENIIFQGLTNLFPDIPIISEEMGQYGNITKTNTFWLIDPLDGTKEFIKRNGEFTINLALIHNKYPLLGIISIPTTNTLYLGYSKNGCYIQKGEKEMIPFLKLPRQRNETIIITSRSHQGELEKEVLESIENVKKIQVGSSLKFCYILENKADIYLRLGPTREWDTAAGQCLIEEYGGEVLDFNGKRLKYNKYRFKNNGFICFASEKVEEAMKILEHIKYLIAR